VNALKLLIGGALFLVQAVLGLLHAFVSSLIQSGSGLWREARADWRRLTARSARDRHFSD
jgi:hypothetical protein